MWKILVPLAILLLVVFIQLMRVEGFTDPACVRKPGAYSVRCTDGTILDPQGADVPSTCGYKPNITGVITDPTGGICGSVPFACKGWAFNGSGVWTNFNLVSNTGNPATTGVGNRGTGGASLYGYSGSYLGNVDVDTGSIDTQLGTTWGGYIGTTPNFSTTPTTIWTAATCPSGKTQAGPARLCTDGSTPTCPTGYAFKGQQGDSCYNTSKLALPICPTGTTFNPMTMLCSNGSTPTCPTGWTFAGGAGMCMNTSGTAAPPTTAATTTAGTTAGTAAGTTATTTAATTTAATTILPPTTTSDASGNSVSTVGTGTINLSLSDLITLFGSTISGTSAPPSAPLTPPTPANNPAASTTAGQDFYNQFRPMLLDDINTAVKAQMGAGTTGGTGTTTTTTGTDTTACSPSIQQGNDFSTAQNNLQYNQEYIRKDSIPCYACNL
jgi:hypothetical protein